MEEFVGRGHQVEIFCPRVVDASATERRFQVRIHEFTGWQMGRYTRFRNLKYLLFPSRLERMVREAARNTQFDFVLSQHAISAVAAGRLKRAIGVPVVMNFLDYLTGFMEAWPAYLAPPPLLRMLKAFELSLPSRYGADGLMTVSDTLADYFAGRGYPRERICPIYYGYDSELFPFHDPVERSGSSPVVVMHGSLDHHHLRRIALDGLLHVTKRRPDVTFRIVGHRTAALEQFLARARSAAPQAKIETTGFVAYDEVARHLAAAHVGIVPYESSTGTHCAFVAKIVEYLALGLPVVSTRLDGAMRYFKDEPMIRFTEFDGANFGEAILQWLQQPSASWHEAAHAASRRVQAELDWRAISRKAVNFVEQTSSSNRGNANPRAGTR